MDVIVLCAISFVTDHLRARDMAAPKRSIVLRAPEGEVGWTLIELQGSMEPRNGTMSLDGVEFGTLVHEVRSPLPRRAVRFIYWFTRSACAPRGRRRGRRGWSWARCSSRATSSSSRSRSPS